MGHHEQGPGPAEPGTLLDPEPPTRGGDGRAARIWLVALLAACAVVPVSWLAAERVRETYAISAEAQQLTSRLPPDFTLYNQEKPVVDGRNAALANGAFGALVGLAFAAAGVLAGGRGGRFPQLAAMGLLLGGAVGAGAGFTLVPLHFHTFDPRTPSLLLPMLIMGGLWGSVLAVAGLAFGWSAGDHSAGIRGLFAGLLGAAAGAFGFILVLAMAFPLLRMEQPLPSTPALRFVAMAMVTACAAVAIARGVLTTPGARPGSQAQ
jgi:hypothetical protein